MKRKDFTSAAVGVLVSAASLLATQPGYASSSSAADDPVYALPEGGQQATDLPANSASIVPASVHAAVAELRSSAANSQVTNVAWKAEDETLVLHVHGNTAAVADLLSQSLPADQAWSIEPAVHSPAEIDRAVQELTAGTTLPGGLTVRSWIPADDGSSITVGVDGEVSALRLPSPPVAAGIPLHLEEAAEVAPSTRIRTSAPVYAGGRMQISENGRVYSCTSGVLVRPSDGEYGNLTADHCGRALNQAWGWGNAANSVKVGTTSGQAGGGTDFEVFRGTANPSVYMLVGAHNVSNQVSPMKGFYEAIEGDLVCYNGAFSGTVCNNEVRATNVGICYEGLQCYAPLTYTFNRDFVPAAGNGDSGGPVVGFALDQSGNVVAYGTGIISGMLNATTTCTGDPGVDGRRCSMEMLFAPISAFANNNLYYSLIVAP